MHERHPHSAHNCQARTNYTLRDTRQLLLQLVGNFTLMLSSIGHGAVFNAIAGLEGPGRTWILTELSILVVNSEDYAGCLGYRCAASAQVFQRAQTRLFLL